MFRKASGRERCSVGGHEIPIGVDVWSGDVVPNHFWCVEHAAERLGKTPAGDVPTTRPPVPLDMTPAALVKEFPAVARVVERTTPPPERWYPDADDDGDALEPEIEDI